MKTLITKRIIHPVDKAIHKFSNHPSILRIKDHYQNAGSFYFQTVSPDAVDKEVRNLNPKKATTHKIVRLPCMQPIPPCHIRPITSMISAIT